MKIVDMKVPKKSKAEIKKMNELMYVGEEEKYPYGLQIHLQKEQLEKMPHLKECKVGDIVDLQGMGKITEVSINERSSGTPRHTVRIQIEKLGADKKKSLNDMSMKEYSMARNKGQVR